MVLKYTHVSGFMFLSPHLPRQKQMRAAKFEGGILRTWCKMCLEVSLGG